MTAQVKEAAFTHDTTCLLDIHHLPQRRGCPATLFSPTGVFHAVLAVGLGGLPHVRLLIGRGKLDICVERCDTNIHLVSKTKNKVIPSTNPPGPSCTVSSGGQ